MAYKINDEIFFLKIDEQVEYLTQVINELYSKDIKIINTNINNLSERINNLNDTKQDKTSDELKTEVKNIVGSINELFDKIESETNRAVNSENEISTNLTEFENHTNTILESHTSSISSINDSINSLRDNKQSKIDEQLQTTSKEVVGAINENHNAIVTNEALIDTKQDKTDNSLETTNKTIVGAINEVNNKIFTDENIDEIKKELNGKANKTDVYTKSEVNDSLNLKLDKASVLQTTGTSTSETISQKVITDNLNLKLDKASVLQATGTSTTATISQKVITDSLNLKQDKGNYIKLKDLATSSYVRFTTIDPVRTIVIIRTRLFLGSSGLVTYTLPLTMPNNTYAVVTNNSLKNNQTDTWYLQPRVWEKTTTSVTFLNQFGANYFDCIIINIG